MIKKDFLRIGVFYDGSFFVYAQNYFWRQNYGWLKYEQFHKLLELYVETKMQGYSDYKIVYSAWFQGLHKQSLASDDNLRSDRKRHNELLFAGIECKNLTMSASQGEKGIDVYMALETLQVGLDGKIDVAILITGDGDFVPLVRTLMKNGIRVGIAFFEYADDEHKSFVSEKLVNAANFAVNINSLENDRDFKTDFKMIFKHSEDFKKTNNLL
ncbi:MAG: NYN domain-containing protein [Bacteroidales bacterium]|nr:NYN domain-containing protein [Bacteroidales bacterium]